MTVVFYIAGVVALVSTLLVVTRHDTIHALLYLIVSLFAVAVVFYTLGAPFVAALEVIVYAGAIIVLFLFTVMLLNIREAEGDERRRLRPVSWTGPGLLAAVLLVELAWAIASGTTAQTGARVVEPREVGVALYGPYAIGVELASTLLLVALIGARHLGQRHREGDADSFPAAVAVAGGDGAGPRGGAAPDGVAGDLIPQSAPADDAGPSEPAADHEPAADNEPAPPPGVRFWRKDDR